MAFVSMNTHPCLTLLLCWASLCQSSPTTSCVGETGVEDWTCIASSSSDKHSDDELSLNLLQRKAAVRRTPAVARRTIEPAKEIMPSGFQVQGRTPKEQELRLSFFLKQQNVDLLEGELHKVADPHSRFYGRHWSNEDVQKFVAPTQEHINVVTQHLQSHGITVSHATPHGDVLTAVMSAEEAEQLLEAKYEAISHVKTGHVMHRCLGGYSLPTHVAAAIDVVTPTVHLNKPPPPPKKAALEYGSRVTSRDAGKARAVRPDPADTKPILPKSTTTTTWYNNSQVCPDPFLYPTAPKTLRRLYSVSGTVGQDPSSKQAVTGFIGQTYNLQNLRDYWQLYCHGILCGKGFPGDIGGKTEGVNQIEAMLDMDVITGVAGNVYTEFWGFDDPNVDTFWEWLMKCAVTSNAVIPKVFSTSYGENEDAYTKAAFSRLNTEFMKLGLRGISVFFASGDEGANLYKGVFLPESPASSPYVTAVGATAPTPGYPQPGSEIATALSSGGFSDYWPMPAWQKVQVQAYLKNPGLPNVTKYKVNTSGRAYPDIAAQGYSFCVTPDFVEGVFGCGVGGTSAASPTSAAIFSLLNDLRAQHNKPPLGFLNPLIYTFPQAFQDITRGYNTLNGNCNSAPAWPAKLGWDAVTGMGTPNYAKLAEIVVQLP